MATSSTPLKLIKVGAIRVGDRVKLYGETREVTSVTKVGIRGMSVCFDVQGDPTRIDLPDVEVCRIVAGGKSICLGTDDSLQVGE